MLDTEYEFSRQDVEDLAAKLSRVKLTPRERSLLLAIFTAARVNLTVVPAKSPAVEETSAGLKAALIKAFIPAQDNADDNFILQAQGAMERVTPIPIKPPPKTPTTKPTGS